MTGPFVYEITHFGLVTILISVYSYLFVGLEVVGIVQMNFGLVSTQRVFEVIFRAEHDALFYLHVYFVYTIA